MTEHPILFSAPMVRAILEDRKTQTRRVVKPQPSEKIDGLRGVAHNVRGSVWRSGLPGADRCPYGKRGDRLWVREAWVALDMRAEILDEPESCRPTTPCPVAVTYDADVASIKHTIDPEHWRESFDTDEQRLRPSIFMPRWASRITLEITSVRVERVQEIGEADAIAEGCFAVDFTAVDIEAIAVEKFDEAAALLVALGPGTFTAKSEYAMLWDRINGKRPGCAWSDNPFVWVIEFKRVEAAQ